MLAPDHHARWIPLLVEAFVSRVRFGLSLAFLLVAAHPAAAQPPFQWAVGVEVGSGDDATFGLAVDAVGAPYSCGSFRDSLALESGLMLASGGGGQDAVVVKRDPGGGVAWARAGGCPGAASADVAYGVAVDDAGSVYVAGAYAGATPAAFGAFTISAGGAGAFVVAYAPDGAERWATSLAADATAWDVAVDGAGHAWVVGSDAAGAWVKQVETASGATLATWSFAGLAADENTRLSIAPGGDVLLSGSFAGTVDFDPGAGVANRTAAGASDGYVARFTPAGVPAWALTLTGTGADTILDHDTDTAGSVYVCGQLAGAGSLDGAAGGVGFVVAKISAAGSVGFVRNVYSQFAGFNYALEARRIAAHDPGAYSVAGLRRQAFGTIGGVALPAEQHFHVVRYGDAGAVQWVKFVKATSLASSLPEPKALWTGAGDATIVAGRHKETITLDALTLPDVNGSSKWAMFAARIGTVAVAVAPGPAPGVTLRAGPNPFRAATTLEFTLARDEDVTLELRDVRGRRVRTLLAGSLAAGPHRTRLEAADLPAGLWFAVLRTRSSVAATRLVRVR